MDGYVDLKQCRSKIKDRACWQFKPIDQFYGDNITLCKECQLLYTKQYNENHKEKVSFNKKIWANKNKAKLKEQKKQWAINNKEELKEYQHQYYEDNKEEIKAYIKQWQLEHKEEVRATKKKWNDNNKEYRKEYVEINREKINARLNDYIKNRYDNEPRFKLRMAISSIIRYGLKSNGGSKNGLSIEEFLPYSIEELKTHLENQFEWWMTWDNWGVYNSKAWNDNDPSTWTWQIDHIIPHSIFNYESMDSEEFRECWSLSNLRPLSAKQNQLDGATKIRHKGKNV